MKKIIYAFLYIAHSLYAFQDDELEQLWSSIADMNCPTLEDYRAIDRYLQNGKRSYLEPISDLTRVSRIRNFQLLGSNGEMPILEVHSFNQKKTSKQRCILLFASHNGPYPDKARRVLAELESCGYSGDVLLRIGGFPNVCNGGLQICHVPYAFKGAFLKEAALLGYKEILWIDTAMHPLTDLENIFSAIREKGYFFTSVGMLSDNGSTHLPGAAAALQINAEFYWMIPHLSSSMIGLNMDNSRSAQLLQQWLDAAGNVYPYITCWPEELSLSVIAWRLGCIPYSWFGNCVCGEHELQLPIVRQRPLQFYIDPIR